MVYDFLMKFAGLFTLNHRLPTIDWENIFGGVFDAKLLPFCFQKTHLQFNMQLQAAASLPFFGMLSSR